MSQTNESLPTIIIEPTRSWLSLKLRDPWQYRELLYFLTWRDVKVRYKQTVIGFLWWKKHYRKSIGKANW